MAKKGLGTQLGALIRKNFLVSVVRHPLGTLLLVYGFPIAILAVLLSIPSFTTSSNGFGVAEPAPVKPLSDVIDKPLVFVRPPNLGKDVDRVISAVSKPLKNHQVKIITSEDDLLTVCLANAKGISNCFASVTFIDSPDTKGEIQYSASGSNHTWQYTVRADPHKDDTKYNVKDHDTDTEKTFLPIQLAVNNAITNRDDKVSVFGFSTTTQEDQDRTDLEQGLALMGHIYIFILFACFWMIIYRFTSFITTDRDSGMSQLIDSMGGRFSPVARVLSWLVVMNVVTVPCYIIFGILYWKLSFPSTNPGLLIGWQILQGLSVNSSTVFAASWFSKARVSSIYVIGAFLLLSVGAQVYGFQIDPLPGPGGAYALIALFSSSNCVFFTQQMVLWEIQKLPAKIQKLPKPDLGLNSTSYGVTQATMLGFLVFQIILYPILAILVEYFMHRISFHSRSFNGEPEDPVQNSVVVATSDLKKRFKAGFWATVCCRGARNEVKAVNGVTLQGHRGQILCLVGPNGSGKTTTLHMIAGFIRPTEGSVSIAASPSQLGICPQRNTLWDSLTVREHVTIWSHIKGGKETPQEIEELIHSCNLENKVDSQARTLSGGQKRKLQLACMFVGDSSVCLIDECTSGLDPLSRRLIWEILLEQRMKRSIIFTTHFLDEVEVLADHITILSKGKVKCHGAVAELKNEHANGYKVLAPSTSQPIDVDFPVHLHQDHFVYSVPDSKSAAKLSSRLASVGIEDVTISGPQVEDVFLNVADDFELKNEESEGSNVPDSFKMSSAKVTSFGSQVWTMLRKRWTILRKFWWPYLYVLALPLIIIPNMKVLLKDFDLKSCQTLKPQIFPGSNSVYFVANAQCMEYDSCDELFISDQAANRDLRKVVDGNYSQISQWEPKYYDKVVKVDSDFQKWKHDISGRVEHTEPDGFKYYSYPGAGGIFYKDTKDTGTIGFRVENYGQATGFDLLNLYGQMKSGVEITATRGGFAQKQKAEVSSAIAYVLFFCLVQAIYPAAFTLYPAIEKARRVRSIQYTNGVRRAPLWVAYGIFDFTFVIVIAVITTVLLSIQIEWFGNVFIILPILLLYGLAAIMMSYTISHFVNGPLKAFLSMFGLNLIMFAIATIAFAVGYTNATSTSLDKIDVGISLGLYLILPIGNVFRSLMLGLNIAQIRCDNEKTLPMSSIHAYGGPIFYLILQTLFFAFLVIWLEGDLALFRSKSKAKAQPDVDSEKILGRSGASEDVEAEIRRVENTDSDLLRLLHLSKAFGSNQAVDDVTLGLPPSEVLALIGPNGAGKSTLVNLIQSDISADKGNAYLRGEDARTRSAQKHLGVCPQYDAMDMLSTRDQLQFYARVKGIDNIKANIDHIMARLGLAEHAKTQATKLSGGNKRKLSLAIALIGTPSVLVLDEPTSAMDAVAKRSFWRIIQSISADHSVLLTTHSMEEADTLATRAAILSRRLLAVGTTQALRSRYSNEYHVSIILRSAPSSSVEEMDSIRSFIHNNIDGAKLERDMLGGQVRFTIPGGASQSGQGSNAAYVINLLEEYKEQLEVEYYSVTSATLENVFLNVVRVNQVQEEDGVDMKSRSWAKRIGAFF